MKVVFIFKEVKIVILFFMIFKEVNSLLTLLWTFHLLRLWTKDTTEGSEDKT